MFDLIILLLAVAFIALGAILITYSTQSPHKSSPKLAAGVSAFLFTITGAFLLGAVLGQSVIGLALLLLMGPVGMPF